MVTESSDQTGAMMIYYSGETFIQRVSHSYLKPKEGTLDEEFVIFMKEYMPAYNYCWEKASMLLDSFNTTFGTNAQLKGTNLDDLTSFSASTTAREEYQGIA